MSDDYSRVFNLVGLGLNLLGVLILFRWGMPFRIKTAGVGALLLEGVDKKVIALEHIYDICGYVGLFLLILGVALQMIAVLMPQKPLS